MPHTKPVNQQRVYTDQNDRRQGADQGTRAPVRRVGNILADDEQHPFIQCKTNTDTEDAYRDGLQEGSRSKQDSGNAAKADQDDADEQVMNVKSQNGRSTGAGVRVQEQSGQECRADN